MQKQSGLESSRGAPAPVVPADVGGLAQRQRIIDAMVSLSAEQTFAATTIADIVADASVSRTTFYKHFTDKRACFDAALDACIEQMWAAAASSYDTTDPPAESVRKVIAAILRLLAAKPALAQVALGEAVNVDSAVVERYRRLVVPALEACWAAAGESARGGSDPRTAFDRVQVLTFDQLASGRVKRLPELLPEIVYTAVLPFAGHEEALRQARLAAGEERPGEASRAR